MNRITKLPVGSPVPLTGETAAMADYVRSKDGKAAIARGLSDIKAGRVIKGGQELKRELKARAAARRKKV